MGDFFTDLKDSEMKKPGKDLYKKKGKNRDMKRDYVNFRDW